MPFREKIHFKNHVKVEHFRPNFLGRLILKRNPEFDFSKLNPKLVKLVSRQYIVPNLTTYAGFNWLCDVMSLDGGTCGTCGWRGPKSGGVVTKNVCNYLAISSNNTTPTVNDTNLGPTQDTNGEYVSFGLARAAGTRVHDNNSDTYTLEKTWTCTADNKIVYKTGLFDHSTAGNGSLFAVVLFGSSVTLNNQDQLKVTWTVDLVSS